MPLFTWYDRYSVINNEIDSQHKTLFDIFNRLYDICIGNDETYSFESVLDELAAYSDYHFKTEECYMRTIGYMDIDKQILEHEYFRHKVLEIKYEYSKGDNELCHELVLFLSKWLLNHVIQESKKIACQ
jgi:hemerythrin